MGKVVVVDGAGKHLEVDESAVPYLQSLGNYHVLTPDESGHQAYAAAAEREYNDLGSTIRAGVEGFVEGATFDLVSFDDEESRLREQYNPIAKGAGKVAGIVAPAIASGGTGPLATVSKLTPAGATARGAEAVAAATTTSKLGRFAVAGTIEGLGEATGSITGAALAGDEVTPEAIRQQLGYGALFGLGAGVVGRGIDEVVTRMKSTVQGMDDAAAKLKSDKAAEVVEAHKNPLYDSPEAYAYNQRIKAVVEDSKKQLDERIKVAEADEARWNAEVNQARGPVGNQFVDPLQPHGQHLGNHPVSYTAEAKYGDTFMRERALENMVREDEMFRPVEEFSGGSTGAGSLKAKAKRGRDTVVADAPEGMQRTSVDVADSQILSSEVDPSKTVYDSPINNILDDFQKRADEAQVAAAKLKAARDLALRDLPDLSLDSIAKMDEKQVAEMTWALERLERNAPDIAAQLQQEMQQALGKAAPKLRDWNALDVAGYHKLSKDALEKLGASHESGKQAVALWATLKAMDREVGDRAAKRLVKESLQEAKAAASENGIGRIFGRNVAGRLAARGGSAVLGGSLGGPIGYVLGWVGGDLLMRGGGSGAAKTVSNVKRAAVLNTAKALKQLTGPGRPAAVAAIATKDKLRAPASIADVPSKDEDEQDLVARRIDEAIFAASPAGKERLADSLTPLRIRSPELAAAVEADARARAEYLAKFAPRKPQWAAMMGDGWQYPQDQIDRFASVYRAVTQPMSVLEDFAAGRLTPEAAKAWRDNNPGLYKLVTRYVMEHFDPSKASEAERVQVSMLLGAPFDPGLFMVPSLQGDFVKQEPAQTGGVGQLPASVSAITEAQKLTQ